MKFDRKQLLGHAEHSARTAGTLLLSSGVEVLKSEGKDIKIQADMKAHQLILRELRDTNIPILSEEDSDYSFDEEVQWIVDPLDGSLNFSRGIPNTAVSIGLMKEGEPVLGVVYDFNRDELYSGIVGEGAWLNGEPVSVSSVAKKSDAVIMSGFPSFTDYSNKSLEQMITRIQTYKKVRLIGSAALSLAYVSAGKADAYYEKDIKLWDVAAGLALVRAAGGVYMKGSVDEEGRCEVSATNGRLET